MRNLTPVEKEADGILEKRICTYCANQGREGCFFCADEGLFRHLAPATLEDWELPPVFAMSELLAIQSVTTLAALSLLSYYAAKAYGRSQPPLERLR